VTELVFSIAVKRIAEPGADRERRPGLDVMHERSLAQALHDGIVVHEDCSLAAADLGDGLVQADGHD